jgi:hypothetical protein
MTKSEMTLKRFLPAVLAAQVCFGLLLWVSYSPQASAQDEPKTGVAASWPGIPSDLNSEPPDPHGAAGSNGVIQVVNTKIEYWTKAGKSVWGPIGLDTFFGVPGAFQSDCKARWDPATQRFYVMILDLDFANLRSYIDFGVSKGPNPGSGTTRDWYIYRVDNTRTVNGTNYWGDYTCFGFDSRAMYVCLNMYGFDCLLSNYCNFGDCQINVLNKSAFLNGTTNYSAVYIPGGSSKAFTLQPCTPVGTNNPGNVAYFGETFPGGSSTSVRVWALSDPLGAQTLTSSTVTTPSNGGRPPSSGAPQKGTSFAIDTLDGRTQGNAFWINGSMWFCTTAAGNAGKSACFYYRIDVTNFPNGKPALGEFGSINGAGQLWTYQPSICGNDRGAVCLVYSGSSTTNYPTIYSVSRVGGATNFDDPILIKASPSYYYGGRWGDYGSVTVDPVDNSFWVTHEWAGSTALFDWRTWFANVHPGSLPFIVTQPLNRVAFQGDSVAFSVGAIGGDLTYQWFFNNNALQDATNNPQILNNLSLEQSGNYNVIVANTVGSSTSAPASLLVVPTVDLNYALNSPANVSYGQSNYLQFSTNGIAGWHGLTNITYDGIAAGQSGSLIAGGQSSGLSTTLTGPGTLTFWWKVSSLQDSDFLKFFVNGAAQTAISGEVDWQQQTYYLGSGPQNVSWVYAVDPQSQGGGLNASWVDEVAYVPVASGPLLVVPPANQTALINQPAVFTVQAAGTPALHYQWRYNGANISGATGSSYTIASAQPSNAGSYSVVVTNNYGFTNSPAALLTVSGVAAWGDNDFGQTGIVPGLTNVVAIAAGGYHNLALTGSGSVVAWGDNYDGQIDVPANVSHAFGIAGGGYHSLAVLSNGAVVAWGADDERQIEVPPNATNVVAVSAGDWHNLALRADGTVVAWGDNTLGQTAVPAGLANVVAIAAGGQHSLALKADGTVTAWGSNLGPDGSYAGQIDVPLGLNQVVAIAAGESHSLALRENGNIVAWGDNSSGQSTIGGRIKGVTIAAGGAHSLAIAQGGTIVAWGDNLYNQSTVPPGLPPANAIAAGAYHSLALLGGPPPGPQLTAPTRNGNQFSVSVSTHPGKAYFLEYKSSLSDTNWTIGSGTVGDGSSKILTDPAATPDTRFYRVRQQ